MKIVILSFQKTTKLSSFVHSNLGASLYQFLVPYEEIISFDTGGLVNSMCAWTYWASIQTK
jgi:hypothetical protein